MPIQHSFSILLCNFKLVYKLLVVVLVVMLLGLIICTGIVSPILNGYFNEARESFDMNAEEVLRHPVKTAEHFLSIFIDYFQLNKDIFDIKLIYLALVIILMRFLILFPLLPVSKIIYSKMTTNFDCGLSSTLISSLPQNLVFSLLTSIVFGIFDILVLICSALMTFALVKHIGVFALTLGFAFVMVIYSLRMTVFSQWLPEIAREGCKHIFAPLKTSMAPMWKNFRKNFICILVLNTMSISLVSVTALPTFGVVPLLLIPTFVVLYTCLFMTLNFTYYHQKYYIDNGVTIYAPTKRF